MTFDTRLGWWLLGCAIGVIIGYFARSLRELREKVEEVDEHVTQSAKKRPQDTGFAGNSLMTNVCLILVVALTAWAAFTSQHSSNKVEDDQTRTDLVVTCTQSYLAKMIVAANARTQFTIEQAEANVNLQNAQAKFLSDSVLKTPPPSAAEGLAALRRYFGLLTDFVSAATKNSAAIQQNPYPTDQEYQTCLRGKK